MDGLKRFYFNLAAGLATLMGGKTVSQKLQNDAVVSRVSREVLYYKTHFFNL